MTETTIAAYETYLAAEATLVKARRDYDDYLIDYEEAVLILEVRDKAFVASDKAGRGTI